MPSKLGTIALITIITTLQVVKTNGGASIIIQPDQVSDIMPEDVRISCKPRGLENKAREIILMQILREQEDPLATIHPNFQTPQEIKILNPKYEVTGYIDNDITRSNLNVNLLKAGKEWSGNYTCKIYYMDESGKLKEDSSDGNLIVTSTDSSILKTIIDPLMKKMSAVENKATRREEEILILKTKIASLEKKAASLEKEKISLKKATTSLQNEIIELEKTSKKDQASMTKQFQKLEQNDSTQIKSLTDKVSAIEIRSKKTDQKLSQEVGTIEQIKDDQNKQIQILINKDNDQLKKIQSLVSKEAAIESKQGKQFKELKSKIDKLPNKASVSSISNRVTLLEKNIRKEIPERAAQKTSISSLTKRVGSLEQRQGNHSAQLNALANTESTIQRSLKEADKALSLAIANRRADKSSLTSLTNKVTTLEQKHTDQSKIMQELRKNKSRIQNDLRKAIKTLSQDVANKLVKDKATVSSYGKKIIALEGKSVEQSKQIKSLTSKNTKVQGRLSEINKIDEKQSKDIKSIQDELKSMKPVYHGCKGPLCDIPRNSILKENRYPPCKHCPTDIRRPYYNNMVHRH